MRILLVGEYSRLHNSLKEGLISCGHDVILVGDGDAFKAYPIDVDINNKFSKKIIPLVLRKLWKKLFKVDPCDYETYYKFKKALSSLKGFDVVQLINEDALSIQPKLQLRLLRKLFNQNKSSFLLCCGQDFVSISHALQNQTAYSILTPYLKNKNLKKEYHYSLKYVTQPYKNLHEFLKAETNGVIATDMDYHIPYKTKDNYLGLIPNPININKIEYIPMNVDGIIHIFHGVNSKSKIKKGNVFFEEALEIIAQKYGERVKITTTYDIPYNQYISYYNDCHILLDQVYSYDKGYNALEAMAKGKVVFTGAEQEWLSYFNIEDNTIAINAIPNTHDIVEKLDWLLQNPKHISEISKNARQFIESEHNFINCAQQYLNVWSSNK